MVQKCVFAGCPFEGDHENLCEYHLLLVDFWFYELDGVKYHPAELTFTMDGEPVKEAMYPETADPDIKAYRARYQAWASGLTREERDRIVIDQGGISWDEFTRSGGLMKDA